jgi:hypothetical protein
MRSAISHWRDLLVVGAASLTLLSCRQKAIDSKDLAGRWTADSHAVALLDGVPGAQGRTPTLELRDDGSMAATAVPDRMVGNANLDGPISLVDGTGTWEAALEDGKQVVRLRFNAFAGRTVDWGTRLQVSRIPRLVLWFDLEDPDEGKQFGFAKSG